jgi:phage repressor protein C with HTH and peptisase S24 domain
MLPTLRPGQIVVAHHVRNFKPGQVVVAHVGSREVIKRVTAVDRGRIFLQGDNAEHSTDSREYGSVVDTMIAGTIIWPRVNQDK